MAEIVNLRAARKARARDRAKAGAAENRAKFGRTKGEKQAAEAETARVARIVEGAWLDPAPNDSLRHPGLDPGSRS